MYRIKYICTLVHAGSTLLKEGSCKQIMRSLEVYSSLSCFLWGDRVKTSSVARTSARLGSAVNDECQISVGASQGITSALHIVMV